MPVYFPGTTREADAQLLTVAAGEDPETVLVALRRKSRDNARTPVQWDASEHAGFTTDEMAAIFNEWNEGDLLS